MQSLPAQLEVMMLNWRKMIKFDLRKYAFTEKIVDVWNFLPAVQLKVYLLI